MEKVCLEKPREIKAGATHIFSRVYKHRKRLVLHGTFLFFVGQIERKKLKITQISMQKNRTLNDLIGKLHASPDLMVVIAEMVTD